MTGLRVAVVSTLHDTFNTNASLRTYLAEGFVSVIGPGNVIAVPEVGGARAIVDFRPHLVIAFGGLTPEATELLNVRRAADRVGAHLGVWLHDDPYELDFAYRAIEVADTIFTNDAGAVAYYRHPRVYHLPLAASPTIHFRPITETTLYDLFFCGFAFVNRVEFFEDAANAGLGAFRTLVTGAGWPSSHAFYSNRRIPNSSLADYYAASACTVTLGRNMDLANSRYNLPQSTPGPRAFEAAMAGCLQFYMVTGLEVVNYFEPEREILLIDRAIELPCLLRELEADPARLCALRLAAQERALRDHSYAARAQTIVDRCLGTD